MISSVNSADIDTLISLNNFNMLGLQRVVVSLLNNWPERGGDVAVSVHNREGPLEKELNVDIPIFELDKIAPPRRKMTPFFRVLGYHRLLTAVEPNVVLGSNQFENLALCLVKRFHDNISLVVPEHNHISSEMKNSSSVEGWFGHYYRRFFSREYNKFADGVLAISQGVADDMIYNHGINPEKITIIHNPVELNRIQHRGEQPTNHEWLSPGNNTLISVSRHIYQKGLDILIRAWSRVIERVDDNLSPAPKLIIPSNGPDTDKLQSMVDELDLEDSIQFVGFIENVWSMVKDARIYINTSRWEGLPLSIIEAQALHTPVVASDCPGGSAEVVMDGDAGFLFETENIESCVETIVRALTTKKLCQKKANIAYENVDRFDAERIAAEYAEYLYEIKY